MSLAAAQMRSATMSTLMNQRCSRVFFDLVDAGGGGCQSHLRRGASNTRTSACSLQGQSGLLHCIKRVGRLAPTQEMHSKGVGGGPARKGEDVYHQTNQRSLSRLRSVTVALLVHCSPPRDSSARSDRLVFIFFVPALFSGGMSCFCLGRWGRWSST